MTTKRTQAPPVYQLLTPFEASQLLGVQPRTLMTWARRGEIPHIVLKRGKDGRATVVRFSAEKLQEWIATKEDS